MREEWNAGYEKGYADAQECCNHNCNQGRDCPKRKSLTDKEIEEVWLSFKGSFKDFARAILRKAQE